MINLLNKFNPKYLFIYLFVVYCFLHLFSFAFALDFYYYNTLTYLLIILSVLVVIYKVFLKTSLSDFPIYSLVFLSIILFLLALLLIYTKSFNGYTDYRGRDSLNNIVSFSQGIIAWLFIGAGFYFSFQKTKIVFYFLFFIFLSFIFSIKGIGVINHGNLMTQGGAFYTHLISSTYIFYIIFLCHIFLKNPFNYAFFIFSCLLLYMTGGRADLFIYILTIFIFGIFFKKNKNYFRFIFSVIFSIVLFILFINISDYDFLGENLNRLISLIFLESNDTSYLERNEFLHDSLFDLKNYIFIGDPNYLIFKYNDLGKYIHNLLSLWQFYGFLFFFFIIFTLILIIKKIKRDISGENYSFGVLIFIFSLISVILAKSAFYYPFWFSVGYMLMFFSFEKKGE